MKNVPPIVSITYSAIFGTVFLFFPAAREGLEKSFEYSLYDWCNVLYLGFFGTMLGFVWFYEGIKIIGPTRAGLFINFVPISAIVLAYLILGEDLSYSILFGAFCVVFGVYLTNKRERIG